MVAGAAAPGLVLPANGSPAVDSDVIINNFLLVRALTMLTLTYGAASIHGEEREQAAFIWAA